MMSHMQSRLGPMDPGGFHGWFQLIGDFVKFVQKEDIFPALADRWVFLHLPSLLKAKWARLFKQSGREPDFSNVMNEATKVGELLLLVG